MRRLRELLDDAEAPTEVHVVFGADEALEFVGQRGEYADAPVPDLVLLDPQLPRESGYELLSELKTDPALQPVPVIVVTRSDGEEDVVESYRRHANAYLRKPDDTDRFDELVRSLERFWLGAVQLPPVESN